MTVLLAAVLLFLMVPAVCFGLTTGSSIDYVDPIPQPTVLITREPIQENHKAGDEFELTLTIQNLSSATLNDCIISYNASEPLAVNDVATTFSIGKISPRKSITTKVSLKIYNDDISSHTLDLNVTLDYKYYNRVNDTTGSSTAKLTIPVEKTVNIPAVAEPVVVITRSNLSPIRENQTFDLTVYFRNAGTTALTDVVAKLSAGGNLLLLNESTTVLLADVAPGATGSVILKLKAADTITSSLQDASVTLKYNYDNGTAKVGSSCSESFTLPSVVTETEQGDTPISSPVPNVIVSSYTYDGDSVAAGSAFDFGFTFNNTGRMAIENIVLVVDGGKNFTINGTSNTYYYTSVPAGGSMDVSVPFMCLANSDTGAQPINVSFRYEYVDNKIRSSASSSITLSVPVFQPDRLVINDPQLYDTPFVGQETTLVIYYVNKGKSDISNVEVSLEGDVDVLQNNQYLGNFGSGSSGNFSFVVTPFIAGSNDLVIHVNYEDPNGNAVTRDIIYTLNAEENYWNEPVWEDPGFDEPIEEEPQGFFARIPWWGYAAAGVVVLAAVLIFLKTAKKHKAKKETKKAEDEWDVFDEPETENGGKKEA